MEYNWPDSPCSSLSSPLYFLVHFSSPVSPSSHPSYYKFLFLLPGKAHIRRALRGHEEALRIYSLCHHLNKLEVLQDILKASHQRSLTKKNENESEEEFADYMEAPDIICECF